jgi:hypothetical protein
MQKYNVFKDKDGNIILEVNVGKGTATVLNLDQSLKDDAKEWDFIDLTLEQYKSLTPITDPSIKQDALNKVIKRMENPTIVEKGWEQVKLFLEGSLKV